MSNYIHRWKISNIVPRISDINIEQENIKPKHLRIKFKGFQFSHYFIVAVLIWHICQLFEECFNNRYFFNTRNSVIIKKNDIYYRRQISKVYYLNNIKVELQNYMFKKDYVQRHKNILLDVLNTYYIKKQNICDGIASQRKHTVLRLYSTIVIFNPIKDIIIWKQWTGHITIVSFTVIDLF